MRFVYSQYGIDFKLHPKRPEPYIVSPYQLVANNGRYYLMGNYDKYDNISHYRVDHITSITMLDEPAKPKNKIKEFVQGFSLPKHMAEHIYMYSGESVAVKFVADIGLMNELVDWFGRNFKVEEEDSNKILVTVTCNENAMFHWALQYGQRIEVKAPQVLRDRIKVAIEGMASKYREENV